MNRGKQKSVIIWKDWMKWMICTWRQCNSRRYELVCAQLMICWCHWYDMFINKVKSKTSFIDAYSNTGGSDLSDVENDAKFCTFWPPVKITGGVCEISGSVNEALPMTEPLDYIWWPSSGRLMRAVYWEKKKRWESSAAFIKSFWYMMSGGLKYWQNIHILINNYFVCVICEMYIDMWCVMSG